MQKHIFAVFFLMWLGASSASKIPARFDYSSQAFGKTYYGSTEGSTFDEAIALCESIGATLLKIRSQEEQTHLERALRHASWLDVESRTRWRDGSEIEFNKFSGNEVAGRACVWVDHSSTYWNYVGCDHTSNVLCEVDSNALGTSTVGSVTVTSPVGGVNLKDLIANNAASNFRKSVNTRFANIERRLEQMSNALFNRQESGENSSSNSTAEAIKALQEKQSSMAESIEDMKRLMVLMHKSLNSEDEV